ncbi:MAG: hypothetical protein K2F64_00775, partial [Muribaculaceae bacterium]|nr:hypothetical protein [Muribaculaceae bacterium]
SYVDTSLSVNTDTVVFSCENSLHDPESNADNHVGIGLKNVRERLNLLYGKEYTLITAKYKNKYVVKLTINNFNLTKIS